jgi:hypothetical protein
MDSLYSSIDGHLLLRERAAEHQAMLVIGSVSFSDCLRKFALAPAIEIATPDGDTLLIRGSDLSDKRTWHKFLTTRAPEEGVYQLTDVGERLAVQYKAWLLKEHTKRYRLISSEAHLRWFERVVCLVVIQHIMRRKYELYALEGRATFADPWVAVEMSSLLLRNELVKESARLIHHIVQDPDAAQQLIEQLYELHASRVQARPVMYREPLPALPAGITPAFGLLLDVKGERDE